LSFSGKPIKNALTKLSASGSRRVVRGHMRFLVSAKLSENNMQERFNRATIGVASTMDIGGRVTAKEINRGLPTRIGKSLWSASLPFFGFLAVGVLIALTPMPGRADEDKDRHPGHEDNDKGIRAGIAALQVQVATLQSNVAALKGEVGTLQKANGALQNEVSSLQSSNTTLQKQLATVQSNHALLLGPFVNLDPNPEIGVRGPNITFRGANIHIVSGSGRTDDNGNRTGLGNLIIGYDEDPRMVLPNPLQPGDRGGSHNLVIGSWQRFTQAAYGGFVAGQANLIANAAASVTAGEENTASGFVASVTGGVSNTASGDFSSVSGGGANIASGDSSSVLGGGTNIASGGAATVTGGAFNTASGSITVILGGQNVTDNKPSSIAPQPPFP
jgi:FtsZ-binding cell division protein ZapB